MNPEIGQILGFSAQQLTQEIAPQLPTQYGQGAVSVTGLMLSLSAQEYERAAEIRAAENREMRALFRKLAPQVNDAALQSELQTAADGEDISLRISALNESNATLRRLIVRLHTHMEESPAMHSACTQILDWYCAMAARRTLQLR